MQIHRHTTCTCIYLNLAVLLSRDVHVPVPQMLIYNHPSHIYSHVLLFFAAIFVLISYSGHDALYCTKFSVSEALLNPSPFCTVAGIIITYIYNPCYLFGRCLHEANVSTIKLNFIHFISWLGHCMALQGDAHSIYIMSCHVHCYG